MRSLAPHLLAPRLRRNPGRGSALAWPWSGWLHGLSLEPDMLGIIAIVLVVLWALGFFAFHVTAAFIHLLLIIAVVMVVLHFVRGRRV
jgi:hypothetical protein